jgi:hypothetical protein
MVQIGRIIGAGVMREQFPMADEKPSLQIDTDWKKQAQEEKKRLAEQEAKKAAAGGVSAAGGAAQAAPGVPGEAAAAAPGQRGQRQLPPATFASLVQSMMTQVLFYLGDLAPRGQQPVVDLDMAKHNIDLLGMLEEKTRGNLTPEEQSLLDTTLYEVRMRYVTVASQYVM